MNPELLLVHFNRISEAPDAVPRLRRFILDLAVRGKLVEQNSTDEPASELLKTIQAEKARLVKEGEIKKLEAFEPVTANDVPFPIPRSWEVIRMGWLARKLGAGSTPLGGKSVYQKEGVPFLRSQNVHDGGLRLDDVALISRATHDKMSGTHILQNDILLNITGASIGRCSLVPATFAEGNVSQHVAIIRLFLPAIREFIHLSLISPFFQKVIDDVQVGVSREGLSMQRLRLFPMLLPPLAEQRRIVTRVNELMALCDRLQASRDDQESRRQRLAITSLHHLSNGSPSTVFQDRAPFYLNHLPQLTVLPQQIAPLRQAVLTLAVCGQLVRQNPTDQSVNALLSDNDRVRHAVACQDRRADAERETLLASENKWNIPASWDWCALADLVLFIDYRGKTPTKVEKGVRLITAKNVKKGFINSSPEEFLSEREYHAWMTRGFPKEGDILFTTEAPMGNAAVVRLPERFALAQRVICFRPYSAVDSDFLALQLLAEPFQSILDKTATGLTAKGIKAAKLRRLPVAVPPLAEQRRIVAKFKELSQLCDQLESQLTKTQDQKCSLLEAVLYRSLNDESKASTMATQLATRSVDTIMSAI
jgi:type I restriction enzyme, S subunit